MRIYLKKIIIALSALILIFSLSACSVSLGGNKDKVTLTFDYNYDGKGTYKSFTDSEIDGVNELYVTPSRTGYEFQGWYIDSSCAQPFDLYEYKNSTNRTTITVYAKWTAKTYTVKFYDANGKLYTQKQVKYDAVITLPLSQANLDASIGYEFIGWYTSKTGGTKKIGTDSSIVWKIDGSSTISLYARYDTKTYDIIYYDGNNEIGRQGVKYESRITLLDAPIKDGYVFMYWTQSGGTEFSLSNMPSHDISLYAKWATIDHSITYYNVDGAENPNPSGFSSEFDYILEDPVKEGYDFLGWYKESSFVNKVTCIYKGTSADQVLYARFEIKRITLIFDANGGSTVSNIEGNYGESVTILSPTREDYVFNGWYDINGILVSKGGSYTLKESMTLVAKWTYAKLTGTAGLLYTEGSTITITGYEGTETNVFIPDEIDGKRVTAIKASAFKDITGITSIRLPIYLTSIGDEAFSGCTRLQFLQIPSSVNSIGKNFVYGCTRIVSIYFEGDVSSITVQAFNGSTFGTMSILVGTNTNVYKVLSNYNRTNGADTDFKFGLYPTGTTSQTFIEQSNAGHFIDESERDRTLTSLLYIDSMPEMETGIVSSEHLLNVIRNGYMPKTFNTGYDGATARQIYENARKILVENVTDSMTDYEKVHAIYDYLVCNITYDYPVVNLPVSESIWYDAYYLEGALIDRIAVCDGYAKAFELLCRMEGIEAICCIGDAGGGHAWNKVMLDGKWFIVDATFGDLNYNDSPYLVHEYLLVGEFDASEREEYANTHYKTASSTYNYYKNQKYTATTGNFDLEISSKSEMLAMVKYFKQDILAGDFDLEFIVTYTTNSSQVSSDMSSVLSQAGISIRYTYFVTDCYVFMF